MPQSAPTPSTLHENVDTFLCPHCGEEFAMACRVIDLGEVRVDGNQRMASVGDDDRHLPPRAFDLLMYMAAQPGRAFSRAQLMDALAMWAETGAAVTQHVHKLRSVLGDVIELRAHPGYGYSLHVRDR